MKKLMILTLCVSSLFANVSFEKNKQYTCLNTHSIQQGQQINVDSKEASKQPFVFTINKELISNENFLKWKNNNKTRY